MSVKWRLNYPDITKWSPGLRNIELVKMHITYLVYSFRHLATDCTGNVGTFVCDDCFTFRTDFPRFRTTILFRNFRADFVEDDLAFVEDEFLVDVGNLCCTFFSSCISALFDLNVKLNLITGTYPVTTDSASHRHASRVHLYTSRGLHRNLGETRTLGRL